ncbi:MAG: hypothetical protein ABEI53_02820 [Candidatus Magasanikbacteria bacterium]
MKKFITFLVIIFAVTGLVYFFANNSVPENGNTEGDKEVQVSRNYGSKIVYTQNVGSDASSYRSDCKRRGGTFRECGNICKPNASACAEVCAYTCTDIPTGDQNSSTSSDEKKSKMVPTSSPESPDTPTSTKL